MPSRIWGGADGGAAANCRSVTISGNGGGTAPRSTAISTCSFTLLVESPSHCWFLESVHEDLIAKLDEVEAEMKRIGFWSGVDNHKPVSPEFESWLQNMFLPQARAAIRDNKLPDKSMVGVMALRQYDYHSIVEEALPLVELLSQFDRLVESLSSHR